MTGRKLVPWTPEEDERLRRLWEEHAPDWTGWNWALAPRTRAAALQRARRLGLREGHRGRRRYERWEDDFIRAQWPSHGETWDGWRRTLGRSGHSVAQRADLLGVHERTRWHPDEDEALAWQLKALCAQLRKSPRQIAKRIERYVEEGL